MYPQSPEFAQIAIDGVFFQIGNLGIARVWRSLLLEWTKSGFADRLLVIDRGGTAPKLPGLKYHPTPLFNFNCPADESFKIQEICDRYQVDLFMSTYYSIPISTPSILLLHDLIPEAIGADLSDNIWQEKHYAIQYAFKYIAISQNTRQDLCRFYPQINPSRIGVALNGIDPLFTPSKLIEIEQFRAKYGINCPYFLIVGERMGVNGYKNTRQLFLAMAEYHTHNSAGRKLRDRLAIVCVGGESALEPELAQIHQKTDVYLLSLTDAELITAYSGAIALVYPSRYEGFGLPILEAMACGCPVITCRNSALPEVAGDAAMYVSETDVSDLVAALEKVQQPEIRQQLITRGLQRSQQFSWTKMADTIATELMTTSEQLQQGQIPPVNPLWLPLRQLESGKYLEEWRQVRVDLAIAQEQIASMETSKFWRLRQMWFNLKKMITFISL